jgi:hypothetical protein
VQPGPASSRLPFSDATMTSRSTRSDPDDGSLLWISIRPSASSFLSERTTHPRGPPPLSLLLAPHYYTILSWLSLAVKLSLIPLHSDYQRCVSCSSHFIGFNTTTVDVEQSSSLPSYLFRPVVEVDLDFHSVFYRRPLCPTGSFQWDSRPLCPGSKSLSLPQSKPSPSPPHSACLSGRAHRPDARSSGNGDRVYP